MTRRVADQDVILAPYPAKSLNEERMQAAAQRRAAPARLRDGLHYVLHARPDEVQRALESGSAMIQARDRVGVCGGHGRWTRGPRDVCSSSARPFIGSWRPIPRCTAASRGRMRDGPKAGSLREDEEIKPKSQRNRRFTPRFFMFRVRKMREML